MRVFKGMTGYSVQSWNNLTYASLGVVELPTVALVLEWLL
jgi:hypothetical protein